MKKKEKTQLHTMGKQELMKLLNTTEVEIRSASVKRYTEQTKNTRALRSLRLKRAVIQTMLAESARTGGEA